MGHSIPRQERVSGSVAGLGAAGGGLGLLLGDQSNRGAETCGASCHWLEFLYQLKRSVVVFGSGQTGRSFGAISPKPGGWFHLRSRGGLWKTKDILLEQPSTSMIVGIRAIEKVLEGTRGKKKKTMSSCRLELQANRLLELRRAAVCDAVPAGYSYERVDLGNWGVG